MGTNSQFKTSDSSLACFLITEHFYLSSIDYNQPRFEYCFTTSKKIQAAVNDFLSGNARTDPSAYSRVNKKLMRVIRRQIQWEDD